MTTKKLAKLLEPAGIAPLNIKVENGTRKGYRRGWFEGYFEQIDAAYAAPVREAEEAVIEQLEDAFDAVEVIRGTASAICASGGMQSPADLGPDFRGGSKKPWPSWRTHRNPRGPRLRRGGGGHLAASRIMAPHSFGRPTRRPDERSAHSESAAPDPRGANPS